jgi:hypothetical protein
MIFCQINQGLIDIIQEKANGRHICDVGCGDGLLGSMLDGVISIDIQFKETALIDDIIHMNAMSFPFNKDCFPVFIRPCHGHFVDGVLHTHKNNVDNFMYVSMPHNLELDIDFDCFNAEEIDGWTGDDGERIYMITVKENI